MASNVMMDSAPLATDFSARSSVIRTTIPKKPAAANVSHVGKVGERQSWSSDETHAQFTRKVSSHSAQPKPKAALGVRVAKMLLRTGPFDGK
jgi:hypothetical protein